jgi:hypothetical protein
MSGQLAVGSGQVPFMLNGKGWTSPELEALRVDFSDGLIRQACDVLGLDARRGNVAALRARLEAWEGGLK